MTDTPVALPAKAAPVSRSGGIVALLFTDLVGSTEMIERLGEDAAEELRRTHFSLLRRALSDNAGQEVKNLGDGLMVVFDSPVDAVRCATAIQRTIKDHNALNTKSPLSVRVGLHVGDPPREDDDFFGTAVVVAKRLCDAADGGQILTSDLVAGLVGSRGGFSFRRVGTKTLKGLRQPLPALAVDWEERPPEVEEGRRLTVVGRPRLARPQGPKLVGRDADLATLDAEMQAAHAGELRCVLLVGDAGVGKTRLLTEFLGRQREEVVVLTARAYPMGETASFELWSVALERYLRDLPAEEVADLCGGFLDDLAGLLRSVAAALGGAPDRDPPRFRLLEALSFLVANVARRHPIVIFFDDVHLADASSWEALHYVARDLIDAPVFIVATARAAELAEHQLGIQVVLGLEQEGILHRLTVHPLHREELRALAEEVLNDRVPPTLVTWLTERSKGNAFFAIGLVRALVEDGGDLSEPKLRSLPEGLAERVNARLDRLDQSDRELLEILAVMGGPAQLDDVVTITDSPPDDVETALEGLTRARFLTQNEGSQDLTYEMAHPLYREAVYQGIGSARRRGLHRAAGRALLATGRLGAAAPHFARSARAGDAEAIEILRGALTQAEDRQAFREALTILGSLVEILPDGDPRWIDVADAMSWQSAWLVDHRAGGLGREGLAALVAIDRVLERSGDPVQRARVKLRTSSFLAHGPGELAEAETLCGHALTLFEEAGDVSGSLLAANELNFIRGLKGDLPGMEAGAQALVERAEKAGEQFVFMQANYLVGLASGFRGDLNVCESALRQNIALAEQIGDDWQRSRALAMLGLCLALGGQVQTAPPLFEQAKAANAAYRNLPVLEWAIPALWLGGRFRAAVDTAHEAVAWSPAGFSPRRAVGMAFACLAALETGQLSQARQYLARAEDTYGVRGERKFFVFSECCRYARALLGWRTAHEASAVDELESTWRQLLDSDARPLALLVLIDLVEVALDGGDTDTALEAAGQLKTLAPPLSGDLGPALAYLAEAAVQQASSAIDPAVAAAEHAVDLLSASGYNALLGRAQETLGRSIAPSDPARGMASLERAVLTFDGCGAIWRRDQARGQYRALLGNSSKPARS